MAWLKRLNAWADRAFDAAMDPDPQPAAPPVFTLPPGAKLGARIEACDEAARQALMAGDTASMDRWLDKRLTLLPAQPEEPS